MAQTSQIDQDALVREWYCRAVAEAWQPDPLITVSEWAERYRELSAMSAAEPGPWRNERTPYLREIMDCLSATSIVEEVDFQKASQVGGTECGNNWVGYIIDVDPGPSLMVMPSIDIAKRSSRQRLAPLISESERLRLKVREPHQKLGYNTLLTKEFPGGTLLLAGANSAANLRSMPIKNLFLDEVDEFPADVDNQGDPVELAKARTRTFPKRKLFQVSSPTIKGASRIEKAYLETDQRRYHVPCPHCGFKDHWRWENFRIPKDDDGHYLTEQAHMVCKSCGRKIEERFKAFCLKNGEWRPTCLENVNPRRRGYHINTIYSPPGWFSWREIAEKWIASQKDPTKLKEFINTILGETWEEDPSQIGVDLTGRCEEYGCEVPANVALIVLTVDVQDNRLEYQISGIGPGEEWYLIYADAIYGDPGADKFVWEELDQVRIREWTRSDGYTMTPAITLIDSGGHHTKAVYDYVIPRQNIKSKVYATKGVDFHKDGSLVKKGKAKNASVQLYMVGTHPLKERIFSRLKKIEPPEVLGTPTPGLFHFPSWTTKDWFEQLNSEQKVPVVVKRTNRIRYEWVQVQARNEALDLTVLSFVGLHMLQTFIAPSIYKDLSNLLAATMGTVKLRRPGVRVLSKGASI